MKKLKTENQFNAKEWTTLSQYYMLYVLASRVSIKYFTVDEIWHPIVNVTINKHVTHPQPQQKNLALRASVTWAFDHLRHENS